MMNPNSQGFAPIPEALWARVTKSQLLYLEQLLKYWDIEVRESIKSMETTIAQYASASAATNATAAFIKFVKDGNIQVEMLKATLDEYDKICKHLQERQLPLPRKPTADAEWIDYEMVQKLKEKEEEEAKKEAAMRPMDKHEPLLAKCIAYDTDGTPLDEQDFKVNESEHSLVEIPWAPWLGSAVGREMDLERSLTSAIHLALHSLHTSDALVHAPIQFLLNETTKNNGACDTRYRDTGAATTAMRPRSRLQTAQRCNKAERDPNTGRGKPCTDDRRELKTIDGENA